MLSDTDIRAALQMGSLKIEPAPADSDFQPASVEVHLHHEILVEPVPRYMLVDPTQPNKSATPFDLRAGEYQLPPRAFALAALKEIVTLDNTLVCRIEGKSSLGRIGLAIHVTAGFVDPGWDGRLTIELVNLGPYTVPLTAGMRIAQLAFDRLDSPSTRRYGDPALRSRYQGDRSAAESRGVG